MVDTLPDFDSLPGGVFLTRRQVAALSGFTIQAFKVWATNGRGPRITYVENRPRYRVSDVRAWLGEAK